MVGALAVSKMKRGKGHMPKRQRDKESHYKSIINKQKSIIKQLKKKAGRGAKAEERFEDLETDFMYELESEEQQQFDHQDVTKCPECGKFTLEVIDLKIRKLYKCDSCYYRTVKK